MTTQIPPLIFAQTPLETGLLGFKTGVSTLARATGGIVADKTVLAGQELVGKTIKAMIEQSGLKLERPLRWSLFPNTTLYIAECRVGGQPYTWSVSEQMLIAYPTDEKVRASVDEYLRNAFRLG